MQKVMAAGGMGIGPGPGDPGMINIPPSILNNPNIPNEIIHALQAGRLGSTVFVANVSAGTPPCKTQQCEPLSWGRSEGGKALEMPGKVHLCPVDSLC